LAIERNRQALLRILASLVAMAGLAGTTAFTSPQGPAPRQSPPPGGLTTADLPTRGRWNPGPLSPFPAISTAPSPGCCVRPKLRRGG
jgi:hypothetical protein